MQVVFGFLTQFGDFQCWSPGTCKCTHIWQHCTESWTFSFKLFSFVFPVCCLGSLMRSIFIWLLTWLWHNPLFGQALWPRLSVSDQILIPQAAKAEIPQPSQPHIPLQAEIPQPATTPLGWDPSAGFPDSGWDPSACHSSFKLRTLSWSPSRLRSLSRPPFRLRSLSQTDHLNKRWLRPLSQSLPHLPLKVEYPQPKLVCACILRWVPHLDNFRHFLGWALVFEKGEVCSSHVSETRFGRHDWRTRHWDKTWQIS